MSVSRSRYTRGEAGRRGDELYDRNVRPHVEPDREGEVVAIDLHTGAWEVDPDEMTAAHRLKARLPDAQIWVVRAGSRYLSRFGSGRTSQSA